ncbi:MAG TPA: lipoate--protein ligase family protein [Opitutus sp.]|nr:lipoate--protein ligase family protein [Opitutus sp.]
MRLEVLPTRTAGAAENMAVDFMMLQRYPREDVSRFRHYGWRAPAFTFGYSQKIAFVRTVLPAGETFDLCRRPTGGGLVDHRDDWTFSLVIPRGHALEEVRATQSYREIHERLAEALRHQGVPAVIQKIAATSLAEEAGSKARSARAQPAPKSQNAGDALSGICFERAELYDVVHAETGEKISGAAQKRNKRGLLFQGSLWRPALRRAIDEERLLADFVGQLSSALDTPSIEVPWPEFNEDEVLNLTENYASPEWVELR